MSEVLKFCFIFGLMKYHKEVFCDLSRTKFKHKSFRQSRNGSIKDIVFPFLSFNAMLNIINCLWGRKLEFMIIDCFDENNCFHLIHSFDSEMTELEKCSDFILLLKKIEKSNIL
jgi:hypothetical protein